MRFSTLTLLGILSLFGTGIGLAQTNPCADDSATQVAINPTKVWAVLPDHNTMILETTTPVVATYEMQFYLVGGTDPVQTVEVPKPSWTLVAGTTDCYTAPLAAVPVALNVRHVAKLVAKAPSGLIDSPPSEPSNPFGRLGPPRTGAVRVR